MNRSLTPLRLAALAALALTTTTQAALFLTETVGGTFSAGSTLGGNPLGAPTPYSIVAMFNASAPLSNPAGGIFVYPIVSYTLNLQGFGTFTGDPGPSFGAFFGGQGTAFGLPVVGFGSPTLAPETYGQFATTTPSSFDGAAPVPTLFIGSVGSAASVPFYNFPLVGVPGGLNSFLFSTITTAAIVPEPSEYAAVAGLALGVFALARRARQASAPQN